MRNFIKKIIAFVSAAAIAFSLLPAMPSMTAAASENLDVKLYFKLPAGTTAAEWAINIWGGASLLDGGPKIQSQWQNQTFPSLNAGDEGWAYVTINGTVLGMQFLNSSMNYSCWNSAITARGITDAYFDPASGKWYMDPGLITEITKLAVSNTVSLIGSTEYLADWVVENAINMIHDEETDIYTVTIKDMPKGSYQFLFVQDIAQYRYDYKWGYSGGTLTSGGGNITYATPTDVEAYDVTFTFTSIEKSGGSAYDSDKITKASYSVTAQARYNINYELNGGTNADTNPITYLNEAIALDEPARTGYTFDGWYLDSAFNTKVTGIIAGSTGDKTFHAKWIAVEYTIDYQLNGGRHSGNPTNYNATSDNITLETPARTGYTFDGWYSDSAFNTKVTGIDAGSTGDKTFYAKWIATRYSIDYQLNGGSHSGNPTSYDVTSGFITLETPARTGYTFDGWYSDSAFNTKVTGIDAGSTGDKTFYAKWIATTYSIDYQLNGGSHSGNPTSYDVTSDLITLETPARTGYTFDGWYSDSAFNKKVTGIDAGSTGNKTFYAKWTAQKYTIYYNANGGKVKSSSKTVTYGSKYSTLQSPTRARYTFLGWYTAKTGGTKIEASSAVKITETTTLYARWKKVTVPKAKINKLTIPASKQLKVTIKSVSGAAGYEVRYSTKSNFKSYKKTTAKSTSAVLKKLKKGKTYYVKVRTFKKDSTGNSIFGKYSDSKKLKVTK